MPFQKTFLVLLSLIPAGLLAAEPARGDGRAWHAERGFRWAELSVPLGGKAGFTLLNRAQSGIFFTNEIDEWKGETNRVLSNGSGLATGDYDHDGLPDLYFRSLQGRNTLYLNDGQGRFTSLARTPGAFLDRDGKSFASAPLGWMAGQRAVLSSEVTMFSDHGRQQKTRENSGPIKKFRARPFIPPAPPRET